MWCAQRRNTGGLFYRVRDQGLDRNAFIADQVYKRGIRAIFK